MTHEKFLRLRGELVKIEFNDHLPIFIQIKEYVQRLVITGELKPGEKTPSVRELSAELEVNPNTAQRAYQELEREGFTYTLRGMGTFITKDINVINTVRTQMAKDCILAFVTGMTNLGFAKEDIYKELLEYQSEAKEEGK
jgi:GntR family transcriptional regulator